MKRENRRKGIAYGAGRLFARLLPTKGLPETFARLPKGNYPPWLREEMTIASKARLPEQIFEDVRQIGNSLQRAKRLAAHALNESVMQPPSAKVMGQIARVAELHLNHSSDPYANSHADANVLLRMGLNRVYSAKTLDPKWSQVNNQIYSIIRRISLGK